MAKTKSQKADLIKIYSDSIKNSKAVYIVEPNKLKANQSTALKKELFGLGSKFNFIKNSLFVRALEENSITDIPEDVKSGQKAVIFSSDKVSESAKVIKTFLEKKENKEVIKIVAGYLDMKKLSADQVQAIADLPSREVMLAKVLATMNAPISGFVNVLAGNIRNIVTVINAIKEQKEKA
jgi:large subunit ribosomal protein L10